MWYYNQFSLENPDISNLFFTSKPENKITTKSCLSLILKVSPNAVKTEFYTRSLELLKEKDPSTRAASAYILSSLIISLEEFSETWKGEAISKLCKLKREGGEITNIVNSTMADFWRVHKSLWSRTSFRERFSEDVIDVINSFNSEHSYFA